MTTLLSLLLVLAAAAQTTNPPDFGRRLLELQILSVIEPRVRPMLIRVPAGGDLHDWIFDRFVEASDRPGRMIYRPEMKALAGQVAEAVHADYRVVIGLKLSRRHLASASLIRELTDLLAYGEVRDGKRIYGLDHAQFLVFYDDDVAETELPELLRRRISLRADLATCERDLLGLDARSLHAFKSSFTQWHASRQPKPL